MKRSLDIVVFVATFALLSGCDAMKKMIDPNGTAYAKPVDTAKPKSSSTAAAGKSTSPAPVSTPAPSASSAGKAEVLIRQKEPGRFLTQAAIEGQLDEITFQARGRSFHFRKALFHDKAGITSLRDSSGKFWGVAIGDLNMDGNDDAVLILRTDRANSTPQWDLAYLPNRQGRLYNVQTLPLQGDQGFRDVVIEGPGVLLVPVAEGRNVHIGYAGGELSFVAQ